MYTSTGRPFFARQIIGAENAVDKREDRGEVLTVIFWVLAMVPMMVLGRGNDIL